jgi:tetratricopeptide (TPR) repeat protein
LVQAVTQDSLPADAVQQWKQRAVLAVSAARPDVMNVVQWPTCERWLPHALLCADWIEQEPISNQEAAFLLNQAGYYLNERGRYREAEPLYQCALAIREQQLGALTIYEQMLGYDHPSTRTVRENYVILLRAMGREEEARRMEQ